MQKQHTEIGRNGVEPATVHDAGTRTDRNVVAVVDAVTYEQHLAG